MPLHRSLPVRVGVAVATSALVLSGCGGSDSDSASEDAGASGGATVRLSALDQGTSGLALKVIEVLGLDEKYGFDAEYQYVGSDASTQNFLQGQSDINFNSSPNDTALAAENDYDAIAISGESRFHAAIVTAADSPYDDMESLKGKTIGWYGSDSTGAVVMGYFLDRFDGIDLFNDYEFVETSPSALVQLLAAGEVDAIMDFQPWNSWAESQIPGGTKVLYDPNAEWEDETGGQMWMTSIATMQKFADANPEEVGKVVEAWCEAADYLNNNMDEVLANKELTAFLEPLDEAGLESFASWVTESEPFSCDWTEDQIANANEFLDALAEQGELFTQNPGDLIVSVTKDGS